MYNSVSQLYVHTYPLPPEPPPPHHILSHSSRSSQSPGLSSLGYILSFPHRVYKSILSIFISIPALQVSNFFKAFTFINVLSFYFTETVLLEVILKPMLSNSLVYSRRAEVAPTSQLKHFIIYCLIL